MAGDTGIQPDVFAGPCADHVALYGMDDTAGPTIIGPRLLDATGITICMTLDATDNIWVAHFGASTWREDGPTSTFQLTLFDAQDTLLGDGWDVTFGSSPSRTFASLEYGVTKGTTLEAKLHVRPRAWHRTDRDRAVAVRTVRVISASRSR